MISLDPAKSKKPLAAPKTEKKAEPAKVEAVKDSPKPAVTTSTAKPVVAKAKEPEPEGLPASKEPPRPSKVIQLVRASKLRHIDGVMSHRSTTIDKLPPLNTTVPGDSNSFHVRNT